MESKLAIAAIEFLKRVELKGSEVATYCDVNNWLLSIAKQEQQDVIDNPEVSDVD